MCDEALMVLVEDWFVNNKQAHIFSMLVLSLLEKCTQILRLYIVYM